jgi:hypothetical protein
MPLNSDQSSAPIEKSATGATYLAHAGNGFLMRHGYTIAWAAWQPDVPRRDGLMALDVPRAKGASGFVRCELHPNKRVDTLPLADRYHIPHPIADLADPQARITMREHAGPDAAPVEIPRSKWRFPDASHVQMDGGFAPGPSFW